MSRSRVLDVPDQWWSPSAIALEALQVVDNTILRVLNWTSDDIPEIPTQADQCEGQSARLVTQRPLTRPDATQLFERRLRPTGQKTDVGGPECRLAPAVRAGEQLHPVDASSVGTCMVRVAGGDGNEGSSA